ncbi:MAG: hypothetical protein M0Q41_13340 [Bacteroidales bacterium]|nr:hypothetical protein [Bacteroidales bacterium]
MKAINYLTALMVLDKLYLLLVIRLMEIVYTTDKQRVISFSLSFLGGAVFFKVIKRIELSDFSLNYGLLTLKNKFIFRLGKNKFVSRWLPDLKIGNQNKSC